MAQDPRPTGAVGTIIDNDALNALLLAETKRPLLAYGEQLLLETIDGWSVVGTEGVGTVEKDGKIDICATIEKSFYVEQHSVPIDAVRALATGEKRDLADHVRRFGSRLEMNFHLWHQLTVKADS